MVESRYGIEFTEPFLFAANTATVNISVDTTGCSGRPRHSITICRPKQDLEIVDCFHLPCWACLKADRPRMKPIHVYTLARSVTPLHSPPFPVNPYTDRFTLSRALKQLATNSHWSEFPASEGRKKSPDLSELTRLLKDIWKRLPSEIVCMVWMYLQSCPTRSLLSVTAGGAAKLLEKITPSETARDSHITLHDHISAHLISINGENYICGLDDGERFCGYRSSTHHGISITSPIMAVTFSLGLYGIRQIRFHSQEGSSRSVGDQIFRPYDPNWTGILQPPRAISHLRLWWDVGADFMENRSTITLTIA